MNAKQTATLLAVLLVLAIACIIYLVTTNPVKGFQLVYERENYKLFIKDTVKPEMNKAIYAGGERVPYREGYERIDRFRRRLPEGDDTTTRYVDFTFDSLFNYIGYVLTEYRRRGEDTRGLGMTAYFALTDKPLRRENGSEVYQRTILLRPTKGGKVLKPKLNDEFDFFNQGSICPVNCPRELELDPPPRNLGQ